MAEVRIVGGVVDGSEAWLVAYRPWGICVEAKHRRHVVDGSFSFVVILSVTVRSPFHYGQRLIPVCLNLVQPLRLQPQFQTICLEASTRLEKYRCSSLRFRKGW